MYIPFLLLDDGIMELLMTVSANEQSRNASVSMAVNILLYSSVSFLQPATNVANQIAINLAKQEPPPNHFINPPCN